MATQVRQFPIAASPPLRYALALTLVLLVVAMDAASGPLIDDGSEFLLLGTAVMASAWLVGTGPALAAVLAGALAGARDAVTSPSSAADVHLALFIVHGLLVTAVVAELARARQTAEAQMRDAQAARRAGDAAHRMKDEFLATVSHELRTPLNAMLGWIHLLRTGSLDVSTRVRGLESIERNARQQARLTGDLLDLSRALTGTLRVESRLVSLTEAARDAVRAAQPAAQAKNVHLAAGGLDDGPVTVLGDETRLRQIAWNLLANAIKFTPAGGSVELEVRAGDGAAVLAISDTGVGIEEAFLPRIFDRFSQEDASPTRAVGGLGVGLSIARDLVELQGGEISAANRAPAGATFVVRLPLQHARATARPAAAAAAAARLDGVRVLLFDQDLDERDALLLVLQQHGADVRSVETLGDALEQLEGWRPDVLLADTLDDNDRVALSVKVRSLDVEHGGRIPAAALTRHARTDRRVRELLAGSVHDLPRPLEPAALTAEIERMTGRAHQAAS